MLHIIAHSTFNIPQKTPDSSSSEDRGKSSYPYQKEQVGDRTPKLVSGEKRMVAGVGYVMMLGAVLEGLCLGRVAVRYWGGAFVGL